MKKISEKKKKIYIAASLLILAALVLYSLKVGSIEISLRELVKGFLNNANEGNIKIIKDIRVPRVLSAVLIGCNLSIAGVLLQAVIRNPLADPYITGISSGASLVTVMIMIFIPSLNTVRPIMGFMGGAVSCAVVYTFAFKRELSPIRIVLVGSAVNALLGGITSLMTTSAGIGGGSIQRWLTGSLATIKSNDLMILFFYSFAGIIAALFLSKNCNIISLGRKNAKSLGVNTDFQMIFITGVAVFLSSVSTSIGGAISFVGLIVPHMCRIIIGSDHKYLIPLSGVVGGILLLLGDTLGRVIMNPNEIPVGIIMSIIGAPFFLYLLRRSDLK